MTTITLTLSEMHIAATTGVLRQIANIRDNRQQAHGHNPNTDWQSHINGAMGECAVAKYLNTYWNGSYGNLNATDVNQYQVRTGTQHHHSLILHDSDPDDHIFILTTGLNGSYTIHGWIYAHEGKKEQYWKDPTGNRPAYFIPQSTMHPINTLP